MKRFFNFLFLTLALTLALPSFAQAQINNNLLLTKSEFIPEFQAWLDKGTALGYTLPSDVQKAKINTMCACLKVAGALPAMDLFYLPLNDGSSEMGTINLISPNNYQITLLNTPTWTSNGGWDWNGTTQYGTANWDPATNAVYYTRDDASVGIWVNEAVAISQNDLGISGAIAINTYVDASTFRYRINDNGAADPGSNGGTSIGLTHAQRINSTTKDSSKNGVSQNARTTSSNALSSSDLFIGAWNNGGSPATNSTKQIAMVFVGASLTGLELATYNCINAYISNP